MKPGKTSTFIFHHDRCDPSKWTAKDVLMINDFCRTGNLAAAANMSRALGMQLVLSELHKPVGGELEHIGWADAATPFEASAEIEEAFQAAGEPEIAEICAIYRGPTKYAVQVNIADADGNIDGTDIDLFDSEDAAEKLIHDMVTAMPDTP